MKRKPRKISERRQWTTRDAILLLAAAFRTPAGEIQVTPVPTKPHRYGFLVRGNTTIH